MEKTAEVHFAQQLASNQPKIREKALKKVGKWLEKMSASEDYFNEEKMLKLWKGLYYYFWHCDKMLFQEDRADVLSKYVHNFKSMEHSFLFIDTFFQTMVDEWHGIDRYRLEKYMMLIRKFLHQCFQLLKNQTWDPEWIKNFINMLKKTILSPSSQKAPFGLKSHVSDIYMEELAKVGSEEVTEDMIEDFLKPYCDVLCKSDDGSFISSVKQEVFLYLINQDADEDTFHEFPILKFDTDSVQKLLLTYANKPNLRRKNMKVIHNIVKHFEDYKNGISVVDKLFAGQQSSKKLRKRDIEKATEKLIEEEQECYKEKMAFKKRKRHQEVVDL